jgi:hypothetical protein
MNDTARVATAADRARQLADKIISKIDSDKWSDKDVRALMIAIIDDRDFINRADVQSAEQAALALQSLSSDLTRRNPKLLKSRMTKSIDDLFREIQSRDDYEPSRFLEKLAAVKGTL